MKMITNYVSESQISDEKLYLWGFTVLRNDKVSSARATFIHANSFSSPFFFFYLLTHPFSLSVFLPAPLVFSFPLLSTHSEILTEMLKLAAAISAPALALKALEQEARGRIKEFIRWCASACTSKHTCTFSRYILIHSFMLICTADPLLCKQTWLHAQSDGETQIDRAGHSGPPPSGCLCQPLCQLRVPSYVNGSLWVSSVCLNEKDKQQHKMTL